jgi:hypothetical protein
LEGRKKRLNTFDIIHFDKVPEHIVNAFFDYGHNHNKTRLIVATFAFLNGICYDDLIRLLHWRDFELRDKLKLKALLENYLTQAKYQTNYYSYSVVRNLVLFLDGKLRLYGKRME